MSGSSKNPDVDLGPMESLVIKTPQGFVWVSTIAGTQVSLYDNPDENPVGSILLREKR